MVEESELTFKEFAVNLTVFEIANSLSRATL